MRLCAPLAMLEHTVLAAALSLGWRLPGHSHRFECPGTWCLAAASLFCISTIMLSRSTLGYFQQGLTSSGCEALDTQNCGGADPGTGALPGPPITSDAALFCGLAPGSELRDPSVGTDSCLSLPLVMRTGPRDRCLTNKGKFLYLFLSCGQGYCLPIFPLPISIL